MIKGTVQQDFKFSLRVSLQYSFLVTILYVIVFVVAQIFNFATFTELRFINYILVFFVCYDAIKKVYNKNDHYVDYFNGLVIGILTFTFGQLWYSILFYIYLNFDHRFLNYLLTEMPQNIVTPKFSIAVLLFLEGFGLSPIISLGLMQYFKIKQGRWAHYQQRA